MFEKSSSGSLERKIFDEKVDKAETFESYEKHLFDLVDKPKHALLFYQDTIETYEEFLCKEVSCSTSIFHNVKNND